MAHFRLNKDKLTKLLSNLTKKKQEQILRYTAALNRWSEQLIEEIGNNIIKSKGVDQGQLLGSTTHEGAHLEGKTLIRDKTFNPTEHASVYEFGRRAGVGKPPPARVLVGWAGRHGITTTLPRNIPDTTAWAKKWMTAYSIMRAAEKKRTGGGGSKKNSSKSKKPLDPQVRDLMIVIGIARSIQKKGTRGRYPFTKALEAKRKTFAKDIAALVQSMS